MKGIAAHAPNRRTQLEGSGTSYAATIAAVRSSAAWAPRQLQPAKIPLGLGQQPSQTGCWYLPANRGSPAPFSERGAAPPDSIGAEQMPKRFVLIGTRTVFLLQLSAGYVPVVERCHALAHTWDSRLALRQESPGRSYDVVGRRPHRSRCLAMSFSPSKESGAAISRATNPFPIDLSDPPNSRV